MAFKDSILLMNFINLKSVIGSFAPNDDVSSTSVNSVVGVSQCFEMPTLTSIGSFSHDCLKSFTGCENGYVFNFWYKAGEFSTLDTEYEVLNFGEFKWFVTYKTGSADGVLVWQNENSCKLFFPMPWLAWGYFSLFVNQTHFKMFFNGEQMTTYGNCTVPATRSELFEIKVGEPGRIYLDELSIVPVQNMLEVPEFYMALTGKGKGIFIRKFFGNPFKLNILI